ncbi:purple acid phosphatase family protein [Xylanimonas protaetiae]|uniref:Metallophosphoesterase family protein n=1 Tax=Xylanimonas protaetiae TaxID=2509457 RepID=A0A4P6F421_9MICO|nr:metallophosphoesterase family protein [Xylanimonas protaetiae]QAY70650.1 metallophosphoesterase family protein [Xylanimonas protaetiae]
MHGNLHLSLRRRIATCAAAAVTAAGLVLGGVAGAGAAAADATVTTTGVILGVGASESQRVVSWYTSSLAAQVVQVVPTSKLRRGAFPDDAATFTAVVAANKVNGGYNAHATIYGLKQNTAYSYRVGAEGSWSPVQSFTTRTFSGDFDFLFFGDPQIGSSGDVAQDGAGWADTLDVALKANPRSELLVSGGDQIETANNEDQWNAFLAPNQLRAYPWVATIGNHDVGGKAYEQHLWTPNTDRSSAFYASNADTTSGGDYWFIYKDVLFIDLNSNAYANGADAAHIGYVTDVIGQHGDDAKYTVLVYHHSIYSPADHANDKDNQQRRQDFPTAFSNLGVDLVLQGHDHSYSRSYLIKNGAKADANEKPGQTSVTQGPGGVIYVTANSASGSKYYDLTDPDTTADPSYGPDPLNPDNHWANSVENQEHVRTYVKVEVHGDKLVVQNLVSGTCAYPNSAVVNGKVPWCGPDSGASPARPVGSVVDQVTIKQPGDKHHFRGPFPSGWISTKHGFGSWGDARFTVTSLS